jgi:hypothetical protein
MLKVDKPFIALKPDADIKEFMKQYSLKFNSIVTSPDLIRTCTLQNLRLVQMGQYLAINRIIYLNIVIALPEYWQENLTRAMLKG